jgi:hypothetical protein
MRKLPRIDQGLALVLLLALLAAWPFLLRPSLPRETDAELHVFRAAELGYALREGVLYPRWAPDFYFGYGYPIFNYYAPLTYYLANLLSLAVPGGAVFGVRAVFVLGFLGAGVGTYGLVRRLADERAGVLAAAVYLFAPYVHFTDPHARGALAEFFALAAAPCALWVLESLRQEPGRRRLAAAVGLVAALILTHNLMAIAFFTLILGYLIWQAIWERDTVGLPFLAVVLGVALAAFFWLPVGLERGAVQLGNLVGPGHFDYHNHFVRLREMLSPSLTLDAGAVNPPYHFNLGLAQWILAAIGTIAAWRCPRQVGYWALAGTGLIVLMLPISVGIWEAVPGVAYLQFPWRLLGPAALGLGILAGQSILLLDRVPERIRPFTYIGMLLAPLAAALPLFSPPGWGDFGPTDQAAMLAFELSGRALGTTSTGDYLPVEVDLVPAPTPEVIASYQSGGLVDKVNRYTLPEGAQVDVLSHRATSDEFAVSSPEDFTLRLYTFMFDGWRASIDGESVLIEVAKPDGFITVRVPAGEHIVRVWLGSTPARTASWAISTLALVASALVIWRMPTRAPATASREESTLPMVHSLAAIASFAAIAALGTAFGWFQYHSEGTIAEPAQYALYTHLQGGIDLLGYDIPNTEVRPGEELTVLLYWKAREPVAENYQVFVHLRLGESAHTWGQSDKLNPGDYPTTRWPTDRYVRDLHTFTIPLGTPPGNYTLGVGLWNHLTGYRQPVVASDGTILGDTILLPTPITVLPPRNYPSPEELPLTIQTMLPLADGITLLGARLHPGGPFDAEMGSLTVALYWRAERTGLPDYTVRVRLVDEQGNVLAAFEGTPADGQYPTSAWAAGEVVRDLHSFWLDGETPDGRYVIEVGLEPDEWEPVISFERTHPAP